MSTHKFFLTDRRDRATWLGCLALATLGAFIAQLVSLFAQFVVEFSRTQLREWGWIADASTNNVFLMTSLLTTLIMTLIFFAIFLQMRGPDPEQEARNRERHERRNHEGHGHGERRRERERDHV